MQYNFPSSSDLIRGSTVQITSQPKIIHYMQSLDPRVKHEDDERIQTSLKKGIPC
jgi:hypothetical protein